MSAICRSKTVENRGVRAFSFSGCFKSGIHSKHCTIDDSKESFHCVELVLLRKRTTIVDIKGMFTVEPHIFKFSSTENTQVNDSLWQRSIELDSNRIHHPFQLQEVRILTKIDQTKKHEQDVQTELNVHYPLKTEEPSHKLFFIIKR